MKCFAKMLMTAGAGWIAMNLAMFLTFRLVGFGLEGQGLLMNPRYQSPKLIAVWSELEPLPLVIARPAVIILGLYAFAFMHAVVYRLLSSTWPPGAWRRGLRYSALLFGVCYLFWEFFTPFNQFGEPLPLVALELVFWAVVAIAEGTAIAATAERLWPATVATSEPTVPVGHPAALARQRFQGAAS